MNVLDLFSGIGGFSLGLERTGGFQTVAFCEIDPFCRRVLAKHWPDVRQYEDVRTLTAEQLRADGIAVDVICGGFPCQDISLAGKGAGIEGERSGLWSEYARLIGELRPRYAIVENVAALLKRGLNRVLGDLAAIGYDAEWHCIPASAVNAPHRRDRVWIIAYSLFSGQLREKQHSPLDNSILTRLEGFTGDGDNWKGRKEPVGSTPSPGLCGRENSKGWWDVEPAVGRVANGVPARMDRLRALGNAVVPQIPELIGRAILRKEKTNALANRQ